MKRLTFFAMLLLAVATQTVTAQQLKSITSPGGRVEVTVFSSTWGVPGYSVQIDGDTLIYDSQLGLRYSGSEITGHSIERVNYKWERTDSLTQTKYNEMTVSFNQPYKGVVKACVRVYDNGFAISQTYSLEGAERTFLQDDNTTIYFAPKAELVSGESVIPVDSVKSQPLPIDVKLEDGRVVTISAGSLMGYPQMEINAYPEVANMLQVDLKPMYEGNDIIMAVLPATFSTPFIRFEVK